MSATPYMGPVLCLTPTEAALVRAQLAPIANTDPAAQAIVAKCTATLAADPRWRTPTT